MVEPALMVEQVEMEETAAMSIHRVKSPAETVETAAMPMVLAPGVLQVSLVHVLFHPLTVLHQETANKGEGSGQHQPLFLFFRHPQLSEQNRHVRTSLGTKFY
jgi:hypothetical protein